MADAYERQLSGLSPHVKVSDAAARHLARDGARMARIMHAAVLVTLVNNGATMTLSDEFPE